MQFEELHEDLLYCICNILNWKDLFHLKLTSKKYNRYITHRRFHHIFAGHIIPQQIEFDKYEYVYEFKYIVKIFNSFFNSSVKNGDKIYVSSNTFMKIMYYIICYYSIICNNFKLLINVNIGVDNIYNINNCKKIKYMIELYNKKYRIEPQYNISKLFVD